LVGTDGSNPRPGWVVLQQRGLTEPQPPLAFLEAPNRTTVGRLTIDPIASVDGRAWLDLIGSAP
jgi:hypothetical protein